MSEKTNVILMPVNSNRKLPKIIIEMVELPDKDVDMYATLVGVDFAMLYDLQASSCEGEHKCEKVILYPNVRTKII